MVNTFDVLGVRIADTNLSKACLQIDSWIQGRQKQYVCVAPVATVMDCQADLNYLNVVNGAGMTTPDGMPVVWLGKISGSQTVSRTYGPDMLKEICTSKKAYRHYFYGATEQTIIKLSEFLRALNPDIKIVGHYAPPFRNVHELEKSEVIDRINELKPDINWVGLGSPKQDFWMAEHRGKLNAPVMVGVGAAFDFLAGVKKQAPKWIQRCGLEWFFRLCCEPKRLWRRYLVGNTKFVWLIFKQSILGFGKRRSVNA